MANDNSGEIMDGVRLLFQRIADFFDLSFFISGVTAVTAILFFYGLQNSALLDKANTNLSLHDISSGWMSALIVLILCYASGMVCFTIGRKIRKFIWRAEEKMRETVEVSLRKHSLTDNPMISNYIDSSGIDTDSLYTFMEAELRNCQQTRSYRNLEKFWILTATYDGVAVALIIWSVVLFLYAHEFTVANPSNHLIIIPAYIAFFISAIFCFFEAQRCGKHQREMIIASFAVRHPNIDTSVTPQQEVACST